MLVSRDGEYMMTGGDKGIVEVIKVYLIFYHLDPLTNEHCGGDQTFMCILSFMLML